MMNSIGNNPFGFDSSVLARRQQDIAQAQLDFQKQSDTEAKAQETEAGGGATGALAKGIKGAKDLKAKIQGGADRLSTLADRLENRFQQVGEMGEGIRGQLESAVNRIPTVPDHNAPNAGNGEDFDPRDANAQLPPGVKPLSVEDYGGTGEAQGAIGELNPADFAMARGQIQTTLQSRYNALNSLQRNEFDNHMLNNMRGSNYGTQYNLDLASQKLQELNPQGLAQPSRQVGSVRAMLGRAQGDMDGVLQPGTGILAGADNGRNLPNLNRVVQGARAMGDDDDVAGITQNVRQLGRSVVQGAQNIHADVQNGVQRVGRMAQNAAQRVSDATQPLSEGLDAGIGAAEGIVDSLGPIGDIIGLGMAIFGGIKAHEEHKEQEASAAKQQQAISNLPTTQTVNTASVGVGGSSMNPLQAQSKATQ